MSACLRLLILASFLMLASCASVAHQSHVRPRAGIAPRAPVPPWRVVIHTSATGPPQRPYSIRGELSVRVHRNIAFGFGHLRVLRREAGELGCDGILVTEPEDDDDDLMCGFQITDVCIMQWKATCIAFD